jgi:colanic acid/amylovoran biosynthesis glycosyltransferase
MPIVYITSHFPVLRETFIAREVIELERRGVEVLIVPIGPVRQDVADDQLPKAEVLRVPLASPAVFAGALAEFARRPWRVLRHVAAIKWSLLRRPLRLAKFLAVLPKSLYLARRFRRAGVRHIHSHWATIPTTCALLISRLEDIPFTFSAHAWDIFVDGNELLLREKIAAADRVFTCTRYNKEHLARFGSAEKIEVMYHGIDTARYEFSEDRDAPAPVVLAGGSLAAKKGLDDLIRALGLLKRSGVVFDARIFGEGPERRALEALIASEGLEGTVSLLGVRPHDDVVDLMRGAAVFVMPSKQAARGDIDGLPNVIAEAMACGAAVVATRFSGIPELVEHEENGLLVEPGDVQGMRDAVARLLADGDLRSRLRLRARERVVEMFDIRRNVVPIGDYFERVLATGVARGDRPVV